jgi:hypothetical protein
MTAFDVAERLAPPPTKRLDELGVGGEREAEWTCYYAALALAAHAEFREALTTLHDRGEPGSRPELGWFMDIATSATAAVVALGQPARVGEALWDLTPECGALNGEYLDYLAELLDKYGVNPADIYRWFEAADFQSTSRLSGIQESETR